MQNKDLLNKNPSNLYYLYVLSLTAYVFFYKEKYILKSAKWDTKALKRKLIGFDEYTIYRVYIED